MMTYFAYGMPILNSTFNGMIYGGMIEIGVYPKLASLLWALTYTSVCYAVAYYLHKKKIFLKL